MLITYHGAAGVHPNTYILSLLLNIHSMLEVFLSIIPAYKLPETGQNNLSAIDKFAGISLRNYVLFKLR
jgi:hypothetical protein